MNIKLINLIEDGSTETICAIPQKTLPDTELLEILKEHFIITRRDVDSAEVHDEALIGDTVFKRIELSNGDGLLVRIEETTVRGV